MDTVLPSRFDDMPVPDRAAYWHAYYPPDVVARATALIRPHKLHSTGVDLHVDLYPQADRSGPVVVMNHGGGGYSGLFLSLALAMHERGYAVVVPDQKAQGRSGGTMGDFTIGEAIQNIVDASRWARTLYSGPLYLAGGSIGGGLTYCGAAALAAAGTPPAAISCLNLFDFGDPRTGLGFTRFASLARFGFVAQGSLAFARVLAALVPGLRLPYRPLAKFREMVDARDQALGFYELWTEDPNTLRTVTARYFASVLQTPAAIPFEHNAVPAQVINQSRDRMVDPGMTRACFERLSGEKEYAEIDWGHFSLQPRFTEEVVELGDRWFRQHR